MLLDINFGRTINPAFSIPSPSLSPSIQKGIHAFLPLITAVKPLNSALSYGLLAIHAKDLVLESYHGFAGNKNWDDLRPQMLNSAKAVSILVLSIWLPTTYLFGSEIFGLFSKIHKIDPSNRTLSIAQIGLQALHCMTIMEELPSYQALLSGSCDIMTAEPGETKSEYEEQLRALAPAIFNAQQFFGMIKLPSLLFRNITDLQEYPRGVALIAVIGRVIQAARAISSNEYQTQSSLLLKAVHFPIVLGLMKDYAKIDLINELSFSIDLLYPITGLVLTISQLYSFLGEEFGKSFVASQLDPVKMDDVVGCASAKESIHMVVDQLKNPAKYERLGPVKPLKGMLLYGPPGTGKSMLAKAFATEINAGHFLACEGSAFVNVFVGKGAATMRALFSKATMLAKASPQQLVVIFIDEINTIGQVRNVETGFGQTEFNSTTEAFLVAIDNAPSNVVVIGATNTEPKKLDPAFTRAGRFDRHIKFDLPTPQDRKAILLKTSADYTLSSDVNDAFWNKIVSQTAEWNFADLDNLIKQAAMSAGFKRLPAITSEIIEESLAILKQEKRSNSSMFSPQAGEVGDLYG